MTDVSGGIVKTTRCKDRVGTASGPRRAGCLERFCCFPTCISEYAKTCFRGCFERNSVFHTSLHAPALAASPPAAGRPARQPGTAAKQGPPRRSRLAILARPRARGSGASPRQLAGPTRHGRSATWPQTARPPCPRRRRRVRRAGPFPPSDPAGQGRSRGCGPRPQHQRMSIHSSRGRRPGHPRDVCQEN